MLGSHPVFGCQVALCLAGWFCGLLLKVLSGKKFVTINAYNVSFGCGIMNQELWDLKS